MALNGLLSKGITRWAAVAILLAHAMPLPFSTPCAPDIAPAAYAKKIKTPRAASHGKLKKATPAHWQLDKRYTTLHNNPTRFKEAQQKIILSDYAKPCSSAHETLTVSNHLDTRLSTIVVQLHYTTPDGITITTRTLTLDCPLEPGQSKKLSFKALPELLAYTTANNTVKNTDARSADTPLYNIEATLQAYR